MFSAGLWTPKYWVAMQILHNNYSTPHSKKWKDHLWTHVQRIIETKTLAVRGVCRSGKASNPHCPLQLRFAVFLAAIGCFPEVTADWLGLQTRHVELICAEMWTSTCFVKLHLLNCHTLLKTHECVLLKGVSIAALDAVWTTCSNATHTFYLEIQLMLTPPHSWAETMLRNRCCRVIVCFEQNVAGLTRRALMLCSGQAFVCLKWLLFAWTCNLILFCPSNCGWLKHCGRWESSLWKARAHLTVNLHNAALTWEIHWNLQQVKVFSCTFRFLKEGYFFFLVVEAPGGSWWLLVAPGSWWVLAPCGSWLLVAPVASWLLGFVASWLLGFVASWLLVF